MSDAFWQHFFNNLAPIIGAIFTGGVGYLYRFAVSGEVDMAASIATVVPSDCGFTARHLYLTTTKLIVINRTATGFLSVVAVNVP